MDEFIEVLLNNKNLETDIDLAIIQASGDWYRKYHNWDYSFFCSLSQNAETREELKQLFDSLEVNYELYQNPIYILDTKRNAYIDSKFFGVYLPGYGIYCIFNTFEDFVDKCDEFNLYKNIDKHDLFHEKLSDSKLAFAVEWHSIPLRLFV